MVGTLENGKEYVFNVRARNAQGAGEAATVTATPVGPHEAPVNLTAQAGDRKVELTWEPPESNGDLTILKYKLRYTCGGCIWKDNSVAGTKRRVTVGGGWTTIRSTPSRCARWTRRT